MLISLKKLPSWEYLESVFGQISGYHGLAWLAYKIKYCNHVPLQNQKKCWTRSGAWGKDYGFCPGDMRVADWLRRKSPFSYLEHSSHFKPKQGMRISIRKKKNWFRETFKVGIPGTEEIECVADAGELSEIRHIEGRYSFYYILLL